jgi:hypothetical protein
MHQETCNGGGQAFTPHRSGMFQARGIERQNHLFGALKRIIQCAQQLISSRTRLHLVLQRVELLGGKLLAFEICGETLYTPRDMADVETDGRQAVRSRPDLRIGKFCSPMSEIFTG